MPTPDTILQALQTVVDPNTGKDFVTSKCIKNLLIEGDTVNFDLELGYPANSQLEGFCNALAAAAQTVVGVAHVEIQPRLNVSAHVVQRGVQLLPGVKNIVARAAWAKAPPPPTWRWRWPPRERAWAC
jgi:ATP-binding protein involved in chromosome partitioning